ncbi:MAG: MFS transporter [Bdellovibrionales bacterium]|nr:MFS transporter [Bdellovibrionales bacterium]
MGKSPLFSIFLVVFLDLVGFGVVIPILPYYSQEFGATGSTLGWLMATYSITQFIFSPFWGSVSDRRGRRPVLLSTILGGSLAMAATAYAPSLGFLFLARALAGFFGANISTASAYIADITSPESRAKGMGVIGAGFGLGFIFGPAIGGVLSRWGYPVPILAASGLGLLNFALAFLTLKEPSEKTGTRRKLSWNLAREGLATRATAAPILLFFLGTLAFTQLEVTFALFVQSRFHLGAPQAGGLLAAMGLVMAAIQGGAIGGLARRFGEQKLVPLGQITIAAGVLAAAWSPALAFFAGALLLVAVGNAVVNPSLSSLASKGAPADRQGEILGVYQSAGSLSRIVGPPLAGYLFDHAGIASPLLLTSFLCAMAALASVRWLNPSHELS